VYPRKGCAIESFTFLFGTSSWIITLIMLVLMVATGEGGYRLGHWRAESPTKANKKDHVTAVQATVAALLGLLLAFTFSMAATRFENRKLAVVDEANAIGTAYLRTSLLPEPQRSEATAAFERYVDVRLELATADWFTAQKAELQAEEADLQRTLWSAGVAAAQLDQRAVTTGLYIQALNEVIDSAGRTDAGLRNHVPESVLYLIFAVCAVMAGIMGYASGVTGGRSVIAIVLMSLIMAAVIYVILDLDRPYRGIITLSQQSMTEVKDMISRGLPLP
jgi:hypothetical protein